MVAFMLKAVVECVDCKKRIDEVKADTYEELCYALQPIIVSAHATEAHIKHSIDFRIVGTSEIPQLEDNELFIRCLFPNCRKAKTTLQTRVPLPMVGALTLVFHTSHEGHPLELTYRGRTWRSPVQATAQNPVPTAPKAARKR